LLDESKFGKRKYEKGRLVEGVWILGGVEVGSGKMFLVALPNRNAETLFTIMKQYIRRGSHVTVDFWKGYRPCDFDLMDWKYQAVNHSENWVDPEHGFCTNTIEGSYA